MTGPSNNPNIPINLKPVYIAINVKIGWIPICPDTIRGSINCLTALIINNNISSKTPSLISPLNDAITAHGIITVAEPKIGNASTKPIPKAAISGYPTFKPIILKIYKMIERKNKCLK